MQQAVPSLDVCKMIKIDTTHFKGSTQIGHFQGLCSRELLIRETDDNCISIKKTTRELKYTTETSLLNKLENRNSR